VALALHSRRLSYELHETLSLATHATQLLYLLETYTTIELCLPRPCQSVAQRESSPEACRQLIPPVTADTASCIS